MITQMVTVQHEVLETEHHNVSPHNLPAKVDGFRRFEDVNSNPIKLFLNSYVPRLRLVNEPRLARMALPIPSGSDLAVGSDDCAIADPTRVGHVPQLVKLAVARAVREHDTPPAL